MKAQHIAVLVVGLAIIAAVYLMFRKNMTYSAQPPMVPYTPDPTQADAGANACRQILLGGSGVAVSTGNPWAMAGGAFAGTFNKPLCDKTSGWGALNPIPGGAETIDKWRNGDKKGAILDILNPLTPFRQIPKFWS
jgi:hypothetical protein